MWSINYSILSVYYMHMLHTMQHGIKLQFNKAYDEYKDMEKTQDDGRIG